MTKIVVLVMISVNAMNLDRILGNSQPAEEKTQTGVSTILGATGRSRFIQKDQIRYLNNYGCWCNFDPNVKRHGHPVDKYDQACKTLHENYECIQMDAKARDLSNGCDLVNTDYNSALGNGGLSGLTIDRLTSECHEANENFCEARLCIVEGYFMQEFIKIAFQDFYFPDIEKFSAEKGFDRLESCKAIPEPSSARGSSFIAFGLENLVEHGSETETKPANETSIKSTEKKCCGDYPIRKPYKTLNGERKCCKGKTYNTFYFTCCSDGSLKNVCD